MTDNFHSIAPLLESPLFALTLSLCAFQLCRWCYQKLNHFALLHPTVSGAVLVAIFLRSLDLDYRQYLANNQLLMFWLGPATVALAVPLYHQLHLIRKMTLPILVTCATGAAFAAGSAVLLGYWLGGSEVTLLSIAPKSVTTPVAMDLAAEIGGLTTLAAGCVGISAVVGMAAAPLVFRLLKISDPKVWGFCLGITAHGMGTTRAFEIDSKAGAFSSLAMGLTALLSAVLIPLVVVWLN